MTGIFMPTTSSNTLWFDENMDDCLTSHIEGIEDDVAALETSKANLVHTHSTYADLDHEHTEYALTTHTHSGYATENHTHTGYADANHTHTDFATLTHSHSEYALSADIDALEAKVGDSTVASQISTAIASKANVNHTHTEYATAEHTHSGYALENHEHTGYAEANHSHGEYAYADHVHTGYSSSTHTHSYDDLEDKPVIPTTLPANGGNADTVDGKHASDFATVTSVSELQTLVGDTSVSSQIETAVDSKANAVHIHSIADITGLDTELSSKYEKPSTGIEKIDLASDVQASLDKADTAIQSLSGYATESYVNTKVAGLVDSSPEALNTLNELAAALGDDPNFATTITTQIGGKVDKVDGKELSSNDYTDAEKTKLAGIAVGANKTVVDSALSATSTNPVQNKIINAAISNLNTLVGDEPVASQISTAIANKVDVISGKGLSTNDYTTAEKNKLAGIANGANNYTHPTHTAKSSGLYKVTVDGTGHVSGTTAVSKADITALGIPAQDTTYSTVTTSTAGLMSPADKTKLNGISANATCVIVDSALSSTSTNPVQNKIVNSAISNLNNLVGDSAVSTQIANAIATKADSNHTHSAATTSAAGFMSAADKTKLNGIATGANKTVVDSALSSSSTNPVQNKVINSALANYTSLSKLENIMGTYYDLATTVTPGENYSSASGSATLVGNMLRVKFSADRSSAANGNISNETVATFSVAHGGKITGGFAVCIGNGTSGHLANMVVSSVSCNETTLTFKITLTATAGETSALNPFFAMPVLIDISKY